MNAHPHTPTLSVIDPRALAIRDVGYCRHPDESVIESRITRQVFNAAGRLVASSDPRLWAAASKLNLTTIYGLSGQSLLTDSVDAGWQLSLLNQPGSLFSFWDARGSQRHIDYDDQQRPITVTEQVAGGLPHVVERLVYGGSGDLDAEHNQCGLLIRHNDPAGSQIINDYGLAGSVLVEGRRFLIGLETPDWPDEPEAREEWLEDQSFITRHTFYPTGELQRQTDAMNNLRTFGYDVAGNLRETWLLRAGEGKQAQYLVSNICYNAYDQIESETAGNGVEARIEYDAENGRLIRLVAAVGKQNPLQDLNYVYDPVGNIAELEDKSQSVAHFNNQRIDPVNRYRYDSLYQLVEAKGWEVADPSHGPALPELLPTPLDPNQRRNYTQCFEYDAAGNLITRHHSGAPGFSMFTSAGSNRSLSQRDDGSLPGESEITSGFDACGNQLELQRGQAMTWDIRNQLSRVTLVKRDDESDDYECYAYDRPGHRLRKVHVSQTHRQTLRTDVRYLPGLEIHRQADGEERHVIGIEAGRSSVRALHWPEGNHADQLRYSLCDHLGSSTLELDANAGVLTQEHYYPFGGTACWAGKSALVAKYKTIRYSGKERNVTGLYYYGYRYYVPWLQRWVCADPLGVVDGLNVFRSFKNCPMVYFDAEGTTVLHHARADDKDSNRLIHSRLVVNFEFPELRPSPEFINYLKQSKPGNIFTGIIDVDSGIVDIYPLSPVRLDGNDTAVWNTTYEGSLHDGGIPIVHGSDNKPSHTHAMSIFSRKKSSIIGFTFQDVRSLPEQPVGGYRNVPAILGMSRSLHFKKIREVPSEFVSVGTNIDDYNKASDINRADNFQAREFTELPTELVVDLVNVFSKTSSNLGRTSMQKLFEAELHRPELQMPEAAKGRAAILLDK